MPPKRKTAAAAASSATGTKRLRRPRIPYLPMPPSTMEAAQPPNPTPDQASPTTNAANDNDDIRATLALQNQMMLQMLGEIKELKAAQLASPAPTSARTPQPKATSTDNSMEVAPDDPAQSKRTCQVLRKTIWSHLYLLKLGMKFGRGNTLICPS